VLGPRGGSRAGLHVQDRRSSSHRTSSSEQKDASDCCLLLPCQSNQVQPTCEHPPTVVSPVPDIGVLAWSQRAMKQVSNEASPDVERSQAHTAGAGHYEAQRDISATRIGGGWREGERSRPGHGGLHGTETLRETTREYAKDQIGIVFTRRHVLIEILPSPTIPREPISR